MNKVSISLLFAGLAVTASAAEQPMAQHGHGSMMQKQSRAWTELPLLKPRMSGEDRASRKVSIVPQNIAPDAVEAWSNTLQDADAHRQLPLQLGGALLDKPGTGGFHSLTARELRGDTVYTATTVYYYGERGADNPTAMFMQIKNELEIIPQPFPREHSRYRANEDWRFLLRFKGQTLASHKVVLETSNGTKAELLTDGQGVLLLRVPDDFKPEAAQKAGGGHDHGMRRGADFVLAAEYAEGANHYLSAFNSSYGEDPYANRDLGMGLGFTLLGMLGAVPLLRKHKVAKTTDAAVKEEA